LIRIVVGLLLVGHGAQKLFGAFGGHGIGGLAGWLGSLGVPAPTAFAWFVGLCEFVGGLLFAVGLLSPIAALAISAVMLGAIVLVHWAKGIRVTTGGLEYPLVLASAAAVGLAGPGRYALDAVYGIILPTSTSAVYLVGLVIELVALAAIQVARTRRAVAQPTAA
jgi:putative oxidoreductase